MTRELTDEDLRQCAEVLTAEPLAGGWPELEKFARAIIKADRALRVPMTPEETDAALKTHFYPARNQAFLQGIRAAERHHGIGEKA